MEPAAAAEGGEEEDSAGAPQPGQGDEEDEYSTAYASEEETGRAILSVLRRKVYTDSRSCIRKERCGAACFIR